MTVYVLNSNQTVTGQGQTVPMQNQMVGGAVNPPTQTFQVVATTTSGNVAATVQPVGSNDGVHWINLGTAITLASGASPQTGSVIDNSTYQYFAANVTVITGTGAQVTTLMAV